MFTLKHHMTMKKRSALQQDEPFIHDGGLLNKCQTASTHQSDEDLRNLDFKVTVYRLAESAMVQTTLVPGQY